MIQLILNFELEKPELPREFDRLMVSFLKASLEKSEQELYERLYGKSKSVIKSFCYSFYLPGAVFQKEKVILESNCFKVFFSNADMGQTIQFYSSFTHMINIPYPMKDNTLWLRAIRMQNRSQIADTELVIKMKSSLLVREHNCEDNSDVYYTYDHPNFSKTLQMNTAFFVQKMGLPIPTEDFSIVPIKGKKVVATVFGRNLDANIGIYRLTGNLPLLNLLYQSGLGVRRGEGHGAFEIIG